MITSFFSSSKRTSGNEDGPTQPKKKKTTSTASSENIALPGIHKKRNALNGYNAETVAAQVALMKNGEGGKWRQYSQLSIPHTIIIRDWKYGDKSYREWFLSPFGMVNSFSRRLATKSSYANDTCLGPELVSVLGIDLPTYDKNRMELSVTNMGNLGTKEFTHISCKVCNSQFIPDLIKQYRGSLPEDPTFSDILNNWDRLKIKSSLMDLAGCFFPLEEHVNAGPNGRRFILRPCEHPVLHTKISFKSGGGVSTCEAASSQSSDPSLSQSSDPASPSSQTSSSSSQSMIGSSQSSQTTIAPAGDSMIVKRTTNSTSTDVNVVSLAKHMNVRMKKIDTMLDPKIYMSTPCRDDIDVWAKKFMVEMVHAGAKKLVSNEATLDIYDTCMNGVRGYHSEVVKKFNFPDGECLPPPPKVAVDRNNIPKVHQALVTSFRESEDADNPYHRFANMENDFYSIMHDGIQKFKMELNGVIIRYATSDLDVVNIPWKLKEIPGGSMNADKLVTHLFNIIHSIQKVRHPDIETADQEVSRYLLNELDASEFPQPPEYFKVCRLLDWDSELKLINLEVICCPVIFSADGCSTNTKAGKDMVSKFGFVCASLRCTVHAADGSLKRLASSKTRSVEAVVQFVGCFRKVMKHFQASGKSTAALNVVLDILNMKKVHMVTFCPTRMAYLLTACAQAVALLSPLSDVLITLDIKREQREYFMCPESMIIMHVLADLEPVFKKNFLRILDTDDALIIDAFRINEEFHETLSSVVQFSKFDKFLESLFEDDYGNIVVKTEMGGNTQTITLNTSSRSVRRKKGDQEKRKVEEIKEKASDLKNEIVDNLMENVFDQCQSGTLIEFSSAFDLHRTLNLDDRVEYIRQLAEVYCEPAYVHHISEENEYWHDYSISISYPPKIECNSETICNEFKNLWPVCNKHWRCFMKDKAEGNRNFWKMMVSQHYITHPNLMQLVEILFAMAPATGPLERSYAKLAKICYKDRNKLLPEHLEPLYLLGILSGQEFDYNKVVQILESSG